MTKAEAEAKIMDKLHEIDKIFHEFDPNGEMLMMCVSDKTISAFSDPDRKYRINVSEWRADGDDLGD